MPRAGTKASADVRRNNSLNKSLRRSSGKPPTLMVWRFLFGHSFLMQPKGENHELRRIAANDGKEKRFPLPNQEQTHFDTKRTLVGLYKQGPLETDDQFAERIVREMQEYQAKSRQGRNTPKPDKES